MALITTGNTLTINFNANELTSHDTTVILPDGYSYEKLVLTSGSNISIINNTPVTQFELTFPPVNSKSPSIILITVTDITKLAQLRLCITKFGQKPDIHYFDKAFEPILVTGDDGNEYNVIPSDQFK